MKIIEPYIGPIENMKYGEYLNLVETAARNCYNSQVSLTYDKSENFIRGLIKRGHESPLEFANISVKIICSVYTLGQLTRHRLASFCVRSFRYCNLADRSKYQHGVEFIVPAGMTVDGIEVWKYQCEQAERAYFELLNRKFPPEVARSVLPSSAATSIIMGTNVREWRHILKLRTDNHAQEDIRNLMKALLSQFKELYPVFFEDLCPMFSFEDL